MQPGIDYQEMLENSPMVTMRLSYEDGGVWKIWYVTKNVERYGFSWRDLMDGRVTWLDMVHPNDRMLAAKQADDYMARRLDDFRLQYRILNNMNESVWITEYSHINRDAEGMVTSVDSTLLNSTDHKLGRDLLKKREMQRIVLNDILLSLQDSDVKLALRIILDRVGSFLNCSRVIFYKDSPDSQSCQIVHEWLNKGIAPLTSLFPSTAYVNKPPGFNDRLQKTGMMVFDAGAAPEFCSEAFKRDGMVSGAAFVVYLHGEPYGFVIFGDRVEKRVWDEETVDFIRNITGLISTALVRVRDEEQLRSTQRNYEVALDNINSYIFTVYPGTDEILFANRAFRNCFGSDAIGKKVGDCLPFSISEKGGRICGNGDDDQSPESHEIFFEREGQWLSCTCEQIPWVDGRMVHLVSCHDITEKKRYEEDIKRQAYTDHLTGLPNRYRCDVDLARAIENAKSSGGAGYLIFIDLDDFKVINDSHGHDFGDGVLVSFARYISELFSGDDHVYRFGGDEFVIIMNRSTSFKLQYCIDALLERARLSWVSLGREFYCTLSIGVVEFPSEGDDPTSLLKKADIAMYQAKKSGKNNFVLYTEGLDSATLQRTEMETLLRKAMQNDFQGFDVYYQPYSRTDNGLIAGAEALIRMRGPDGNLLPAERFIDLAEYLGLMTTLGDFVLSKAVEQCKSINTFVDPDFSMTFNLSSRQFGQKDILDRLDRAISLSKVNPANLIVSVSEKVAIQDMTRTLQFCEALAKKEIRVALDDFGTGSSSLINLRNLPVNLIKISARYIDQVDDQFVSTFLKLIADLAHDAGKLVCMNGVETDSQLDYCRRVGIDMAQGFRLDRPGDSGELQARVRTGLTAILSKGKG